MEEAGYYHFRKSAAIPTPKKKLKKHLTVRPVCNNLNQDFKTANKESDPMNQFSARKEVRKC
jgi:hypothetical protein